MLVSSRRLALFNDVRDGHLPLPNDGSVRGDTQRREEPARLGDHLHVPGLRRALREVLIEGGSNLFGNLEICSVISSNNKPDVLKFIYLFIFDFYIFILAY